MPRLLPSSGGTKRTATRDGSRCIKRQRVSERGVQAPPQLPGGLSAKATCRKIESAKTVQMQARREALLQRIHKQLRDLNRCERRRILEGCFTHAQRSALEQWMRAQPAGTKACARASGSVDKPRKMAALHTGNGLSVPFERLCSVAARAAESIPLSDCKARLGSRCAAGEPRRGRSPRGTRYYHAEVCLGSLRISSSRTRSEDEAANMQHAIAEARDAALLASSVAGNASAAVVEQILLLELPMAFSKRGLTLQSAGLRLAVQVHPFRWVEHPVCSSRLHVPTMEELKRGLAIWKSVEEAYRVLRRFARDRRSAPVDADETAAWHRFEEAFVELQVAAGREMLAAQSSLSTAVQARQHYRLSLEQVWTEQSMALEVAVGHRILLGSCARTKKVTRNIVTLLERLSHLELVIASTLAVAKATQSLAAHLAPTFLSTA